MDSGALSWPDFMGALDDELELLPLLLHGDIVAEGGRGKAALGA